jgi:uncharacterized protein YyaL (SSP411 family)
MTTDLTDARSPFLRHGATQPVHWMPWGEAAFERARRENRPILLDIGAVWCHWCHVMDRESYEDEATAALINDRFVAVKVDRDERPDVDARYQRAIQVLTGQGGWPLTAFLTPDGDVFHGGTYFPPSDQQGRPAFRRVLSEIAHVWSEEPARAAEAVQGIEERLHAYGATEATRGELAGSVVDEALDEIANSFDFRHGGFGRAPKFPNAGAVDLLIDRWIEDDTEWARRAAAETLTAMARGGICDQLGGGFHRYSTDARWIIPHFEKMAYDNGVLLETYARACTVFDDPLFAEAVAGVIAHYRDVSPDLVAAGGFPASQDADYGFDNDGDYWTWAEDELRAALNDETLFAIAALHFGLDDPGTAMHLDPSRHVLFRRVDAADIAKRLGLSEPAVNQGIAQARAHLKRVRDERPRPFVDETLYAGWVALVASGHIAAARWRGRTDAGRAGLAALRRIMEESFDAERGVAHRVGDRDAVESLEDQALVAKALLDAFEWTQDLAHLESARAVLDAMVRRFRHESGAFHDRPPGEAVHGALRRDYFPIADAPAPSGNGSAALALLRMAALTDEERWHELGTAVLRAFAGSAARLGSSACTYVKAMAWATRPVTTIVVVRREGDPAGDALLAAALGTPRVRTVVRAFSPDQLRPESLPQALRAMVSAHAPRAYLCAGTVCAEPVTDADALRTLMRSFRAR